MMQLFFREFCSIIVDKFKQEKFNLNENSQFENAVKSICDSLEKQCLNAQSIEREHIDRAIEVSNVILLANFIYVIQSFCFTII